MVVGGIYEITYWEVIAGETYITDRNGEAIEPTITCNRYIEHDTGGSSEFELTREAYVEAFKATIKL